MKNSKKGATMVEAAIVFPLTLAAIMAVIYLMINLYSITALQSSLHVELRGEAGAKSGLTARELADGAARDKYRAAAEGGTVDIQENTRLVHPYVSTGKEKSYSGNAMITKAVVRESKGRYYIVDEPVFFRRAAFLKGLVE